MMARRLHEVLARHWATKTVYALQKGCIIKVACITFFGCLFEGFVYAAFFILCLNV
jgi:hypothetical protein